MRGFPGSTGERPGMVERGLSYVLRTAYADGYDQGRFGLRFPSGRVEWRDPRPPKGFRDRPEVLVEWWSGHRAGVKARVEIDHAESETVPSGAQGDGPGRPAGVREAGAVVEGDEARARGPGRRGCDAAPSRGVVERRAPGRNEARAGVPDRVGVSG